MKRSRRRKIIMGLMSLISLIGLMAFLFWYLSKPAGAVPWASTLSSWGKRKQLTLVNNSGSTLNINTTYQLNIDTKTLSAIPNDVMSTCDDIRIVYQPNSTTATELSRSYQLASGSTNCTNSSSTIFSFPLQAAITNGSSDSSYYVYYSNHNAPSYSSVTALQGYNTTPGSASFVAPFNGTTTAIASGSATPTTATGAIRYSGGKSGLSFRGRSGDKVASTDFDTTTNQLTLEAWIYPYVGGGSIIAKNGATGPYDWNLGLTSGGRVQFRTGSSIFTTGNNAVTLNQWNHVAAAYNGNGTTDANRLKIFVNGVYWSTSGTVPTSLTQGSTPVTIGNDVSQTMGYFTGFIDEVRVSDNVRYTSNFTPQTSPFVRDSATKLLLHFDENGDDPRNSGKAIDDSGNGNNGTITGAKYVAGLAGVDDAVGTVSGKLANQAFVSHQGVFIEEGTTNKITNPSFENSSYDTNWTASASATLTANTTAPYYKFGSNSAKMVVSGANASLLMTINAGNTNTHTLSAYVYDGTTGNVGGTVGATVAQLFFNGAARVTTYTDMGGGWWRLTYSAATINANDTYGVDVKDTKTVYIDGVQLEEKAYATTYADGTMGTGYAWTGTVNNSTSTRTAGNLQYSTTSNIGNTAGTISFWIKPSTKLSGSSGFLNTGEFFNANDNLRLLFSGGNIQFNWSTGGNLKQVQYNIVSMAAGSWYNIVGAWANNGIILFVNSTNRGSNNTVDTPSFGTTFSVGGINGSSVSDTIISDVRIFDASTSATQVTQLYNAGLASHQESAPINKFSGPEDPVAYWKFDEGTGVTAYNSAPNPQTPQSGNIPSNLVSSDLNATLTGTTVPTWQTSDLCVSSDCLFFDGATSKVTASATPAGIMSVAFWVKEASSSGTIPIMNLSPTINITASGTSLTSSGLTSPIYYINGQATTTPTLTPSQWTHVEVTTATSFTASQIILGNTGGNSSLLGFMDEVKVYAYQRTAAQVQTDYNSKGATTKRGSSATLGASTSDALNKGLVGYWKMDEATWSGVLNEVVDSSGNGNHGTAQGPTNNKAYPGAGKFGNGGVFDGIDNYVDFGGASSLNSSTNKLTLAAWVKGSKDVTGILGKWGGVGNTHSYLLYANVGVRFVLSSDGSYQSANELATSTSVIDGKWHHVVGTYDGSYLKVYVDGALVQTKNIGSIIIYAGTDTAQIGTYLSGQYWNGTIDEARIYNRALSPAEVQQLYNFAPGPVGYWKFDEGTGGAVNDSSGNGNTGTWNGAGTTHWVNGKYGKAGNFDGSTDYVTFTGTQYKNITLEAWVKRSVATSGNTRIINTSLNAQNGLTDWSGKLAFRAQTTNGMLHVGDANWPDTGSWHYIVGTYDGVTGNLYIDGVLQKSASLTGSITDTFGRIGNVFPGSIDDVRIYNYARTPDQILEDMAGRAPAISQAAVSASGKTAADYWPFEEGYGTTTKSNGTQTTTGTLTSMASPALVGTSGWQQGGKYGKAIAFDGSNDYVSFGDLTYTESASQLSWSFWVNPNSLATQKCLLCKWQNTQAASKESWAIETGSSNSSAVLVEISTDGNATQATGETASGKLSVGNWTHIAVVYDGTQTGNANMLKIYINGVLQTLTFGATAVPATTQATTSNARAGASSDSTAARLFSGIVDEIKIYPAALASNEILTEYNHGSSIVLGSISDTSGLTGGSVASNSASAYYCVPGDTTSCAAPVAEWTFDEGPGNTTVPDRSGNNNTGTWSGGGTHYVPGKQSWAGGFNGSNDSVGFSVSTSGYSQITLEAWFLPLAPLTSQESIMNSTNDGITINTTWGGVVYRPTIGGITYHVPTSFLPPLNVWTHVIGTYDGSAVKIYINGVQKNSVLATGSITGNFTCMGHCSGGLYFKGRIDQARVFNYARSAAQIAWDYNRGKPVGQWDMDECTGTTLHDSVTASNAATLTIGTAGNAQTSAGTCADGLSTSAWNNGATGKYGPSVKFDGADDYATVTTGLNTIQTVSFWAKPASSSGTIPFVTLATTPTINISSSNLAVSATGFTSPSIYVNGQLNGTLTANNWNHVLVTTSTSLSASSIKFANVGSTYFLGQLDAVKIWNYQLTKTQILQDLNQGAGVRFGPLTGSP